MAPIFSTRFLYSHQGASASYTVPSGKLAVLRSILVTNTSATAAASFNLGAGFGLTIVNGWLPPLAPGPPLGSTLSIDMRVVLHAGELIATGNQATIDMIVCGYLFDS
jgi:hypothetical protein